jgi:hypothetical protein
MRLFAFLIVVGVSTAALADAPAPWAVCTGKSPGASCASNYYPNGKCVAIDAGTSCPGGLPDGGACIQCQSSSSTSGTGGGVGCDVGAPAAVSGLGLFGLLFLFASLRRRRA